MKRIIKAIVQYYLKILTKIVLYRHKPLVIAIAGTTNKTFSKEMILEELGRGPHVRGNPKSFNTEIGLPLAVLFLPSGYSSVTKWADVLLTGTCISIFARRFPKVLVLELGVDRKGDMDYLLSMVKPSIGIVTSIDKSFPENNTTIDDLVTEISALVKAVPKDGLVILNHDEERVKNLASYANGRVIFYGKAEGSDARIENVKAIDNGQSFDLQYDKDRMQLQIERFGWHNVTAIAIAKVVAKELEKLGKIKK